MSETPLVSTVIPTRNRAAWLPGAVLSAMSQVDAHGKAIAQEIIIADDASTDETPAVADGFVRESAGMVRYVRVQTGTGAGTRNAGAKLAIAPFLAFLDDDDVWLPGRLQNALAVFANAAPTVALVYGQTVPTDAELRPDATVAPAFPMLPLSENHPVEAFLRSSPHINAALFRREAFAILGGFDETLAGYEDVDLLLRLVRRYECRAANEPLALMRVHTDALNDAPVLWRRFADETRARRYHLSVKDAYRPPLAARVRLMLSYRGWFAHRFLTCAAASAATGNHKASGEAIRYALDRKSVV